MKPRLESQPPPTRQLVFLLPASSLELQCCSTVGPRDSPPGKIMAGYHQTEIIFLSLLSLTTPVKVGLGHGRSRFLIGPFARGPTRRSFATKPLARTLPTFKARLDRSHGFDSNH